MNSELTTDNNLIGAISTKSDLIGNIKTNANLMGNLNSSISGGIKIIYANDIIQQVDGQIARLSITYDMLPDKPLINDKELMGGINNGYYADTRLTNTELENIFNDW